MLYWSLGIKRLLINAKNNDTWKQGEHIKVLTFKYHLYNPLAFLCLVCPVVSCYSSTSTCPFPSKISRNRKLSLPFWCPATFSLRDDRRLRCSLTQQPSPISMTWGSETFCSQWAGLKMPHIPHHSHSEYTPVNTPPWPHTQKCGYFLHLIFCTSHHAHPKHTWNTKTSTFSATPPTTEWKWIVKHRVEKMRGVIHSHGVQVITEILQMLLLVKGGRKRTCSSQRSLQPLKCLSSVECKGCQESTVS